MKIPNINHQIEFVPNNPENGEKSPNKEKAWVEIASIPRVIIPTIVNTTREDSGSPRPCITSGMFFSALTLTP